MKPGANLNDIEMHLITDLQYLELVDGVSQAITRVMRFDEDKTYWIGMAIREGVINAMLHGNGMDMEKVVQIQYEFSLDCLTVTIHDQGQGFDPETLPDPLDPQNLLKPCGRGLLCIKSFMDDVSFHRASDGMTIRMIKRLDTKIEET